MTISTSDALKAQQACYDKAKELGIEGVICIMDDSARLVSKLRMDGATLSCLEIAERKAYTSVMNRKPSDFFASFVQPNGLLVGLPALGGGRYTVIAGGLPVFRGVRTDVVYPRNLLVRESSSQPQAFPSLG